MAKDGLIRIICAGAVVLAMAELATLSATDEERNRVVAATLAVQTAMQQGRDFLQRSDARSAVFVLEGQLSQINGNATYLALLRDAYRAYVKELRRAGQEAEVKRYLLRLQILDPGAALDLNTVRGANAPALPKAAVKTVAAPPKPEPKVRLLREDDDRPKATVDPKKKVAGTLLARAEEEFASRRYREACVLFEEAHHADAGATDTSKERWAYCKLFRVVEQMKQSTGELPWVDLERETRQALQMNPRLASNVKDVLVEIDRRRGAVVTVRHFERGTDGWARAETTNFRIFHNQPRELAERVAQVAERTRAEMMRKWLGDSKADWNPRCDLYLHATARDYNRVTGVGGNSPGHSKITTEGGRVLGRRIDLHCEDPANMVTAVLPHETTHVVLAGQFGEQLVPRWADEGIAVLTEPRDKIDRHLANLVRCRQEKTLFTVRQLMLMADYPEPRQISAFYAQSVSLVEYLAGLKGPLELTAFLRDAPKLGCEQALTKHYGFRTFDELQQQWSQKAFAAAGGSALGALAQHAP